MVCHGCELNGILAAPICIDPKLSDHGFVLGAGSGKDIEVRQHLRAIDRDVEDTLTGCCKKVLRKMQPHGMGGSCGKAWKRAPKLPEPPRFVAGHRSRLSHTAGIT